MKDLTTIVWFRNNLRLEDNPVVSAALKKGKPVIPLYIWAPDEEKGFPPGGASRWWLHQSLSRLDNGLNKLGSRLIIRCGSSLSVLQEIMGQANAETLCYDLRYEPQAIRQGTRIQKQLQAKGYSVESFLTNLLYDPAAIKNKQGNPYRVFTPFYKQCCALGSPRKPLDFPSHMPEPKKWPASIALNDLHLDPKLNWTVGLHSAWSPGEQGAKKELTRFLAAVQAYPDVRDRPYKLGTSRLSPHLHFGEISPQVVWWKIKDLSKTVRIKEFSTGAQDYIRQLIWREFAHYLLYHFPQSIDRPLRPMFKRFPWRNNSQFLRKWQIGETGYPIVDAGMRELWTSGWMHNRVRMIVASFLVKDLLISWQEGAKWFWDTLVDADLANNTLGWQWTAGCGTDAAPFFRVFNPTLQGQKFDPDGEYVRTWLPVLNALPKNWIHRPWEAPDEILNRSQVKLGENYPVPIVNHGKARDKALNAYRKIVQS